MLTQWLHFRRGREIMKRSEQWLEVKSQEWHKTQKSNREGRQKWPFLLPFSFFLILEIEPSLHWTTSSVSFILRHRFAKLPRCDSKLWSSSLTPPRCQDYRCGHSAQLKSGYFVCIFGKHTIPTPQGNSYPLKSLLLLCGMIYTIKSSPSTHSLFPQGRLLLHV